MSFKIPVNNGININELQWKNGSLDTNVKLAGEEAKDRLYEPKHKKKLVRVLTVIAYVFFVSLAAIMLSLYYVFLWNGDKKVIPKYNQIYRQSDAVKCDNILAEMQQQITAYENEVMSFPSGGTTEPPTTTTEETMTFPDYEILPSETEDLKTSAFIKRLMYFRK